MTASLLNSCLVEVRDPNTGKSRGLTEEEVSTLYDILYESVFPDEAQRLADVLFEGVVL